MLEKVRKTIEEYSLLARGERVVVAVSGGPDSVALLKVLTMLAEEFDLFLLVAHFNHGLRTDDADREENFVRLLAQSMGVEFFAKKRDISCLSRRGKSLEELCREERYRFLEETARICGASKIALGHHLRDQAETVLMNLLRGCGSEGLRGMMPLRDGIMIRPLLHVRKEEVLDFLKQEKLSFMSDSSNSDDLYLRNRIRRHLIPVLRTSFNPRVEENFARMAEIIRQDNDFIESKVGEVVKKWGITRGSLEKKVAIPELLELHEAIQHRVMKTLLDWTASGGKGIGYRHVKSALALAQEKAGSRYLHLPGGIILYREYDLLYFQKTDWLKYRSRVDLYLRRPSYRYDVEIPGKIVVHEAGMMLKFDLIDKMDWQFLNNVNRVFYLDYEALHPPLVIRSVKPGDRFRPLGMKGTKKLKAFFIDEKVPRRQRDLIPVLEDQESIVWIAGMRTCARTVIKDNTQKALAIEII